MYKWNSLKLPETHSEHYQEMQEDTGSILLNFVTMRVKKWLLKTHYIISSESALKSNVRLLGYGPEFTLESKQYTVITNITISHHFSFLSENKKLDQGLLRVYFFYLILILHIFCSITITTHNLALTHFVHDTVYNHGAISFATPPAFGTFCIND